MIACTLFERLFPCITILRYRKGIKIYDLNNECPINTDH